jgi:hypothetical protein
VFLDALASIIGTSSSTAERSTARRVGRFGVKPAARGRRDVAFYPATELEVAVNRHHVTA